MFMHPAITASFAEQHRRDLTAQAAAWQLARAARRQRHQQGRRLVAGRPAAVLARCLYAVLSARPIARPRAA